MPRNHGRPRSTQRPNRNKCRTPSRASRRERVRTTQHHAQGPKGSHAVASDVRRARTLSKRLSKHRGPEPPARRSARPSPNPVCAAPSQADQLAPLQLRVELERAERELGLRTSESASLAERGGQGKVGDRFAGFMGKVRVRRHLLYGHQRRLRAPTRSS